jgi:hypothetical protein
VKRGLAIALVVAAACGGSRASVEPRPAPPLLSESSCASCHAQAADDWRGSMHHASFTSGDFQRSYAEEPRDYCVDCHAPLPDRTAGIGCTACHAADQRHASRAPDRAHATTKECRSCHDFDVPGAPTMLQGTEREHRASAFAERSCESCHMQRGGGHRFDVTRNRDFLARAIRVSDAQLDAAHGALVVRVASHGVGHRFPTGDLFRRLTVVVAAYDRADALRCAQTFYLRRDVDDHRSQLRAKQPETDEHDTRLDDAPRELRVACAARPARVHVSVTYERGAGGIGDDLDAFATLELFDEDVALR